MVADLPLDTRSEVDVGLTQELAPPRPQLVRIFECHRPLAPSARHCLAALELVEIGRGESYDQRGVRADRRLRLNAPDPWMSAAHARLVRGDAGWVVEDAGSRNGTLVNGVSVERAALADGDLLELGRTCFLFRSAAHLLVGDPPDLESSVGSPVVSELATLHAPLAHQLRGLVQVAATKLSVVITGETGTGKERIAQAVHALSGRGGAFVAVNCGALPETLIEAELFGCHRGAFTGARDRPGLIRTAEQGTLFLDEVADLPLPAQAVLLRVLQEREVHALGATHPVAVDFRLICATQEPLDQLVKAGRFRGDLLARMTGLTVHLPPLRERREDLGIIIATLLRRLAPRRAEALAFDKDAARALLRYPFEHNIRELEKILERALAFAGDGPIRTDHLALEAPTRAQPPTGSAPTGAATSPALDPQDLERKRQLIALLDEHGGNLSATARSMGKAPIQIRRWLRRYQIDVTRFRR